MSSRPKRRATRSSSGARRRPPGLALLLVLMLLGTLLVPAPVAGHAFIRESDPAAIALLPASPATVTLEFTERRERSYSKAELWDQSVSFVGGTSFRAGDSKYVMLVDLPPILPNGTYSILWQTLSLDDGHTAQGYIPFTIGTGADVQNVMPPSATTVSAGPPDWMPTVSRWVTYLGLVMAIAAWPVWLAVMRPGIAPAWQIGPTLTRRIRGFAVAGVLVALLGGLAALLVQAIDNPLLHTRPSNAGSESGE